MQILFVSDEDMVRGPIARVLSMKHAQDMGAFDVEFDSAGVKVDREVPPLVDTIAFMRGNRMNIAKHLSKPLNTSIVRGADLLLAMTHDIAKQAKAIVGARQAGKIVVLNEAVGFGRTPREMDIDTANPESHKAMMSVFSQLKATTGRLVRMICEGERDPADYGAMKAETKADHLLDDPHLRHFLVRYIMEFIERSFEPPTTRQIQEALTTMGRPLSPLDIEELIRKDLRGKVGKDGDGRWDIDERVAADEERERRAKAEQRRRTEQRGAGAPGSRTASQQEPPPTKQPEKSKLTVEEALEVLSITLQTPFNDAQKSYRQLQMRYHPDKFQDDEEFRRMAEVKARMINMAWEVIQEKLPK